MFGFSDGQIVTALVSAFFIGFSKTTGMSLGTAIIPFFATAFPVKVATGILCLAFLLGSFQAFRVHFRSIQLHHIKTLLPGTLIGFVIGGACLLCIEDNPLRLMVCVTTLAMLLFSTGKMFYAHVFERCAGSTLFDTLCGMLIGITSIVANAGSPIMVVYLLAKNSPKNSFVATQVAFFLLLNAIKLPFYLSSGIITTRSFELNLIMLPCILIGGTLGVFFLRWLPEGKFRWIVSTTSILSALKLGFSAL